jgi:hypothetical protein
MSNPIIISKSIKSNEKESAATTTILNGRYGERVCIFIKYEGSRAATKGQK